MDTLISGARLLGPVARRLLGPDRWIDEYPALPAYAKELDVLLEFADQQGCLNTFVPKLESRNNQRDEALNELRVAYWFDQFGFPIGQWEPPGLNGKIGEFLISTPEKQDVFVELKSPGWESELSQAERLAGRTKQPKYRQGDGGAFGNWQAVQRCIASAKTYPKFTSTRPNLLIIADDLKTSLFDSVEHVDIALYANHTGYGELGYFTSSRFQNVGGVAVFRAFSADRGIEYEFKLFDNPNALATTNLPESILKFKTITRGIVRGTGN